VTFRCRALLDIARQAPRCMACDRPNDGTVVAAHSNFIGKGTGTKAPDWAWAAMDADCHREYDQGKSMCREDRRAFWMRAFIKTQDWLWSSGLIVVCPPGYIPPPEPVKRKAKIQSAKTIPSRGFQKPDTPKPWPKRSFSKR